MNRFRLFALGIVVAAAGTGAVLDCTALSPIALDVCGNSIVEPEAGEQCDNFPVGAFACYAKDAGTRACHVACGDGGACPAGWGCGADGVCRQPAVTFRALPTVTADVLSVSLADFDGDHQLDLVTLGSGVTRVHYFDTSGAVAATAQVDLLHSAIATGDLTSDGLASLVVFDRTVKDDAVTGVTANGTGVELFRGQTDRTLAASLFKSFPLPGATDARSFPGKVIVQSNHPGADDIVVFVEEPSDGGTAGALGYYDPSTNFQLIHPFSTAGVLTGDIPTGHIPNNPDGCDSAVVGFKGNNTATVIPLCSSPTQANLTDTRPPTTVSFAPHNIGLSPILLADVVGADGILDIVMGPSAGVVMTLAGDSTGGFGPAVVTTPATLGPVLAVGDLDGDGKPDYVDRGGILFSSNGARLAAADNITTAYVRDANHDGFLDVIAITRLGVDFFSGTGGVAMNHRFYDIPGTTFLAVGDFDGDSNVDAVVATSPPSPSPSSISVLYGNAASYPSDPVALGDVTTTLHVAAAKLSWFFGEPNDSIASLIVMGRDTASNVVVIPVKGSSDRQLTSPLVLTDSTNQLNNRDAPLAGAVGTVLAPTTKGLAKSVTVIASPPGAPDASATAIPLRLWTAPASTDDRAVLDTNLLVIPPDGGLSLSAGLQGARGAAATMVDLDPSAGNGDEMVIVVPSEGTGSGTLTVASLASGEWAGTSVPFDGEARTLANGALASVKLVRADFDGDGLDDVLVVYGPLQPDGGSTGAVAARVLFNDDAGHLVSPADVPIVSGGGVAVIHAKADATAQVVVAGSTGLVLYALQPGTRTFDQGTTIVPAAFDEAIDAVCGDVNGDGVEDLVIAHLGGFDVLLGQAVIP